MYVYKITLSFNTSALFPAVQEVLDSINSFMDQMAHSNGKLVARTNGFDMSLQTGRELQAREKSTMTRIILDTFEKYFPDGGWLVDKFELVEKIN